MAIFWRRPRNQSSEDDFSTIYWYALSVEEIVSCGTIGFPKILTDSILRTKFKSNPKPAVIVRLPSFEDAKAPPEEKDSFIDDVLLGKTTIDFIRQEKRFDNHDIDVWNNCLSVIKTCDDSFFYIKSEEFSCGISVILKNVIDIALEMGIIAIDGAADVCTLLPLTRLKSDHAIRSIADESSCFLQGSTLVIQKSVIATEDYKLWWLNEDFEETSSIDMAHRILEVCISRCHLETYVLLENGCVVRFNPQNDKSEYTIPHLRHIADSGKEHLLVGVVGACEVVFIDFEQKRIRYRHELACKMVHLITPVLNGRFLVATDCDLAVFDLQVGFVPVLRLDLALFGIDSTIDHIRWLLPNLLLVLHNNGHILCFIGDFNGADPVIHSLTTDDRVIGMSLDEETETMYLLFENSIVRKITIDTLLSMDTITHSSSQIESALATRSIGNLDNILENIFAPDTDVPTISLDSSSVSHLRLSKAALAIESYW